MNRVQKIQKELIKQKLDALIVRVFESDNQNVLYLSGFGGSAAHLLITQKQAFIIVDPRYWLRVPSEVKHFRMVKLERKGSVSAIINDLLKKAKAAKKPRVAFEATHVSVDLLGRWNREIKATLVPTVHFVERLRQFKDEDEIDCLRKACRSTSKVYNEVLPLIRPGMTESELCFEIDMRLRKNGATANSFTTIVASGPNSAVPHHSTGSRKLKAGEPVVMDFGGIYTGGYCSDITRTAFVPGKKPDARLVEIYKVVLDANRKAAKVLKPGIMYTEFDRVARDYIESCGYGKYFSHGLGHSLGLVAHDPYDYLNDPFQEGMVVTDEPGIYIEGFGGVRIEDDLVVTADGFERLTNAPYWKF